MTNDKDLRDTFVHLSAATAQVVKDAFRMRADWKKKAATEAHVSGGAAVATSEPTEGEAVGARDEIIASRNKV